MGGIAVAIGLVIDDAVVVVERLHRVAAEGGGHVADAIQPLLAPLVSSTLTSVVVFAPLGLLSGVPGQFFRALSLSLTVAVILSLFLSVTLVPLLAKWTLSGHPPAPEREGFIDRVYRRWLDAMLSNRIVVIALALLL